MKNQKIAALFLVTALMGGATAGWAQTDLAKQEKEKARHAAQHHKHDKSKMTTTTTTTSSGIR